ncbi:MAG: hypothetical protein H0W06_02865 [Chloroflexia bacterium]|nr:hypothetical protein [Chloroflexia bacterium]
MEDELRQYRWAEVAVVLDPATGREIWRKQGAQDEVGFAEHELVIMENALLAHNHPIGWRYPVSDPRHAGTSFSQSDIALAMMADVAELRAVTPLLRFSLKRPGSGWPDSAKVLADYDAIDREVELALLHDMRNGSIDEATAVARHGHEVVSRLSLMHGLNYT